MTRWNDPEVVDYDVGKALDAALSTVDGTLFAFVEYDATTFNVLHTAEELASMYPDEATMLDHFERIHSYVHIDFSEMQLFTDTIVPVADEVRYIATAMDALVLVRYYRGKDGAFMALSPGEDVDAVIDAVETAVGPREG